MLRADLVETADDFVHIILAHQMILEHIQQVSVLDAPGMLTALVPLDPLE